MRASFRHLRVARALALALALALSANGYAWDPASGDFSKTNASDLRLMAWNVEKNFLTSDPTIDAAMTRIFQVVQPDIIAMQEVPPSFTFSQIRAKLDAIMPLGPGTSWTVQVSLSDGFNRNVLAARFPMSLRIQDTTPASEVRGVAGALIDLPAPYPRDIYVMSVHFKCCSTGPTDTARRQQAADAVAKWFGDIRTPGGEIDLPDGTPVVVMGDFNFVDPNPQQPEVTLRTGDIIDTATYGSPIKGDWDNTDLVDVQPADPFTSDLDTWPSGTSNPSSRLDRLYYTDSAAAVGNKWILNTRAMTSTARTGAGLFFFDSENSADHLPIIIDFTAILPVELTAFKAE